MQVTVVYKYENKIQAEKNAKQNKHPCQQMKINYQCAGGKILQPAHLTLNTQFQNIKWSSFSVINNSQLPLNWYTFLKLLLETKSDFLYHIVFD